MSVLVKEPEAIVHAVAGFSEETVRAHAAARNEPAWMLEFRLDAWRQFEALPWPAATDEAWRRTRLTGFDLKNFTPFATAPGKVEKADLSQRLQEELNEMDSAASMVGV